ncbi:MAG: pyridoxal phosphate-dependent aminotransferase [Dysgonamonadaceae bacterium]|jgi:cystathionine beta-lyase|nr:pyridoxal phosphate-dependent aminotransferase [Dysgonamonadaceae bacterium]
MKYNFDEIIDRSATNTVKFGGLETSFGNKDLIALWVADMDFKSPPCIIKALEARVQHGVFGYTRPGNEYYDAIVHWLKNRHQWAVEKDWITYVPGVVKGFAFVIDAFTEKRDCIIIQPPVYHPFRLVTEALGRVVVNNPLILENGQYRIDFEAFEKAVRENNCKLFIFSNPHNPGGRVWTRDELKRLSEICAENNVLVVSDEIHSDLTLYGHKHLPFASVSQQAADNCITLMAPSKTFNIAGIVSSFAVVSNEKLRAKYLNFLAPRELDQGSIFSYTATVAAYEGGEEWLDQLLAYIQGNIEFVDNYLKQHIPQIKAMIPEASFLVWLDCRELNLPQASLVKLFIDKAGLALNNGTMFGPGGEGFMRLNVGSPRSILEKALKNLKKAIAG